jgi:hypothetical protein
MNKRTSISELHGSSIIIDGCAPILRDCNNAAFWIEGGATCALATVALHDDTRTSTLDTIGRLYSQIKDRDDVIIALQTEDIIKVKKRESSPLYWLSKVVLHWTAA